MPVPSQLLGLLPDPPTGGWPADFLLGGIASRLRMEAQATETAGVGRDKPAELREMVYVAADPAYPPRKRAERLSWLIWSVIGMRMHGAPTRGLATPFMLPSPLPHALL